MNITSIHQYYFTLTTSELFGNTVFSNSIHVRACIQMSTKSIRPGAIPNPESESKDESESESGFDSGFGIMCSGIGFGVGIV